MDVYLDTDQAKCLERRSHLEVSNVIRREVPYLSVDALLNSYPVEGGDILCINLNVSTRGRSCREVVFMAVYM